MRDNFTVQSAGARQERCKAASGGNPAGASAGGVALSGPALQVRQTAAIEGLAGEVVVKHRIFQASSGNKGNTLITDNWLNLAQRSKNIVFGKPIVVPIL